MRDKAYRKKQEAKKSYKKFVSEMKHEIPRTAMIFSFSSSGI